MKQHMFSLVEEFQVSPEQLYREWDTYSGRGALTKFELESEDENDLIDQRVKVEILDFDWALDL